MGMVEVAAEMLMWNNMDFRHLLCNARTCRYMYMYLLSSILSTASQGDQVAGWRAPQLSYTCRA